MARKSGRRRSRPRRGSCRCSDDRAPRPRAPPWRRRALAPGRGSARRQELRRRCAGAAGPRPCRRRPCRRARFGDDAIRLGPRERVIGRGGAVAGRDRKPRAGSLTRRRASAKPSGTTGAWWSRATGNQSLVSADRSQAAQRGRSSRRGLASRSIVRVVRTARTETDDVTPGTPRTPCDGPVGLLITSAATIIDDMKQGSRFATSARATKWRSSRSTRRLSSNPPRPVWSTPCAPRAPTSCRWWRRSTARSSATSSSRRSRSIRPRGGGHGRARAGRGAAGASGRRDRRAVIEEGLRRCGKLGYGAAVLLGHP